MLDKLIFIDDQEDARRTFRRRTSRLFRDIADVVTLAPCESVESMVRKLDKIKNKVVYVIDEDLTFVGNANYTGSLLIEKIRELDSKIPIYILTSNTTDVEEFYGNVEYVIDKVDWNNQETKNKIIQRILRHISTYKDIKSEQAKRLDYLLAKSLTEPLTEPEQKEYNSLNVIRSKSLLDESVISNEDLDELNSKSEELDLLHEELKRLLDE